MGTPAPAVPALEATARISEVRLVVTMPDRPRGRSGTPQPSPVKEAALDLGLPVEQPANEGELLQTIAAVAPVDVGVVVAFGTILKPKTLGIPRCGFVNLHFSLLPRWRGAAPVERAVLAGDSASGVTLMVMERGLDTGAVVSSREIPIGPHDTSATLLDKVAAEGASLVEADLERFVDGFLVPVPQDPGKASYASKIEPSEARILPEESAVSVLRRVRGFNPRPGAFAFHEEKRFKIWAACPAGGAELEPGELALEAGVLLLGVGDGVIELLEVQSEGSRRMEGGDWSRGRRQPLGRLS
jgi:methionyl-tRNA formyltransferase